MRHEQHNSFDNNDEIDCCCHKRLNLRCDGFLPISAELLGHANHEFDLRSHHRRQNAELQKILSNGWVAVLIAHDSS